MQLLDQFFIYFNTNISWIYYITLMTLLELQLQLSTLISQKISKFTVQSKSISV